MVNRRQQKRLRLLREWEAHCEFLAAERSRFMELRSRRETLAIVELARVSLASVDGVEWKSCPLFRNYIRQETGGFTVRVCTV